MEISTFEITGRVIETKTEKGIYNLRVEAWDKDVKYNDLLGNAITNDDGGFTISFDATYFREYAPDTSPDVFFKIYQGKKLLKSTEDAVMKNARVKEDVIIKIAMPALRLEGKDRVSSAQVLKVAEFLQQSDFKGIYDQFRSKAGTTLGFISDMVVNTVSKLDVEPVKVTDYRNDDIIGQDVEIASRNLASKKIEVSEVKAYNPRISATSISELSSFPANLKPGQKVTLYEENGKIRYYALVKEKQTSQNPAVDTFNSQKEKLQQLEEELTVTRKNAVEKDEQITKLQKEMETLRNEHNEIKSLLNSETVLHLLQNIQKLEKNKDEGEGENRPVNP